MKSYCSYTKTVQNDTIIPVVYKNMQGFFVDNKMARKQIKKMGLADSLKKNEQRYIETIKEDSIQINNYIENETTLNNLVTNIEDNCDRKVKKINIDNKRKNTINTILTVFSSLGATILGVILLLK